MNSFTKIFILTICILIVGCTEDPVVQENEALVKLNIEVEEGIPTNEKIDMTIHEFTNSMEHSHDGKIKRRGGFSIAYPKHSYEIDLNEDISLAYMPADDDWVLNANYIDKTFIRHVLSYELFSSMNFLNISSRCEYVELELNGDYNGLYVLMQKLDKSSLDIMGSDSLAMIFKEPHIFRETYAGIPVEDFDNFHQQTFPKIEVEDKSQFIEDVRDFILNQDDTEFQNEIANKFDLDNVVDWHLLLLISNNSDGILKNFYLYKRDNYTPLRIAPWDYDHSFGRDGDNELNIDERPLDIERSILFKRLLKFEWYEDKLKDRWDELNDINILSISGLKQRVFEKSEMIRRPANKNFEIWEIENPIYYDDNNFDQEIEIIYQFIDVRHKRLSDYFDTL